MLNGKIPKITLDLSDQVLFIRKKREKPMNHRSSVALLLLPAILLLACKLLSPSAATITPAAPGQTSLVTSIPAVSSTLAVTQTPASYPTNLRVEKNGYGIQIVDVERTSASIYNTNTSSLISPAEGNIFIKVTFELSENGKLLGAADMKTHRIESEILRMNLVDSDTNIFTYLTDAGFQIILANIDPVTFSNDFVIYFSVPIESKGFNLKYRDLPLIDLGL
jgi:hypothetical protein